jgi:restriction system protein
MTAPAATRRTRKTNARTRHTRRLRLPRLGWGWIAATITAIGIAQTWPIWTGITVALLAAVLLLRGIRPKRLNRLWQALDRATARRSALPAPGRRTISTFQRLAPGRFEQAIAELALRDERVVHATVLGGPGDNGMDIRVQLANGTHVLIQCKRHKNGNNVPSSTIRETVGSVIFHNCHVGAIVTTADFTHDAYATNAGLRQPLRLIKGSDLEAWANGHGLAPF